MTYALPTKTDLNGTPSEGTFKTAIGALYDYLAARLGGGSVSATTAEQLAARNSLGVPVTNWAINPDGEIAQALPATSSDGDYDFDMWIALTQTGSVASTQISNPEDGYRYGMRMTQSQAGAQRMGRIQIIEGKDAIKLRGKAVTYGGRRRLSSSANIRLAIVEWTGTEDSAVKDVVNDWTSGTYTTGNFFKSTTTTVVATAQVAMTAATAKDCSVSGTISSSATNILVFEWTESTVAQNVTFDAWGSRLIESTSLIDYIRRLYADELRLCQRHMAAIDQVSAGYVVNSTTVYTHLNLPVSMRGTGPASVAVSGAYGNIATAAAIVAATAVSLDNALPLHTRLSWTASGLTGGQGALVIGTALIFRNQIGA